MSESSAGGELGGENVNQVEKILLIVFIAVACVSLVRAITLYNAEIATITYTTVQANVTVSKVSIDFGELVAGDSVTKTGLATINANTNVTATFYIDTASNWTDIDSWSIKIYDYSTLLGEINSSDPTATVVTSLEAGLHEINFEVTLNVASEVVGSSGSIIVNVAVEK